MTEYNEKQLSSKQGLQLSQEHIMHKLAELGGKATCAQIGAALEPPTQQSNVERVVEPLWVKLLLAKTAHSELKDRIYMLV